VEPKSKTVAVDLKILKVLCLTYVFASSGQLADLHVCVPFSLRYAIYYTNACVHERYLIITGALDNCSIGIHT